MPHPGRLAATALALLALLLAPAAAPARETPRTHEDLDATLAALLAKGRVPGAAVVLIEDGQITLQKSYGVADRRTGTAVTADTVFRVGSISKTVTALAVFALAQEGRLALDGTLADLAPEIAHRNPYGAQAPVRLFHLLEHTSGWPDISFGDYAFDGRGKSLRAALERNAPHRLSRWWPGSAFSYSNAGPAVAGYLVEKAAGEPFASYVRKRILRMIGMETADFALTPELEGRLARSYRPDGQTEIPFSHIGAVPSGALLASPRDLVQLPLFMLNRGRVNDWPALDEESILRMERSDPGTAAAAAGLPSTNGAGTLVIAGPDYIGRGHGGAIDGFFASYGYFPGTGAGFVILTNGGAPDPALQDAVAAYLLRDVPRRTPPVAALTPETLDSYAGHYQPLTPRHGFERLFNDLIGVTTIRATEFGLEGLESSLIPAGEALFVVDGRPEPTVAFTADAEGAVRLVTRNGVWQKISPVLYYGKLAALFLVIGLLVSALL